MIPIRPYIQFNFTVFTSFHIRNCQRVCIHTLHNTSFLITHTFIFVYISGTYSARMCWLPLMLLLLGAVA